MPVSDRPILILGGTAEATVLAHDLLAAGFPVISSLAGRTSAPKLPEGEVRTGGFGGTQGLADYISLRQIAVLVDATHPFAFQISRNALQAARLSQCPFIRLERPGWTAVDGDHWIDAADIDEAVAALPAGARAFLALGRQHIAPFLQLAGQHYVLRMIEPPDDAFDLAGHEIVLARPGTVEEERRFLEDRDITHIVCRNSGGSASYAKIVAARQLNIPVVMIGRPQGSNITVAPDVQGVVDFVRRTLRN